MTESCPSCGNAASGRFCSHCGGALGAADCSHCGNALPAGARFCNECGRGVATDAEPAGRAAGNLPWIISGVALAALAAVLIVPRLQPAEPPLRSAASSVEAPFVKAPAGAEEGAPGAAPAPAGNARAVDLNSMTPREAADRLFNRVMQSVSVGDTVQARGFLPMAIGAYDRIADLDRDGYYHRAILQLVGGNAAAARADADRVLNGQPTHLFGLFTAAQAEALRGNQAEARALYQRFLNSYDAEVARNRPEYREHEQALAPMKEEATKAVASR